MGKKPTYQELENEIARLKKTLDSAKKRLNSILDNTRAIIYIKDKEGCFTLINKEFERYFNVLRPDVLGKTDYDLMPKELADKYKKTDQMIIEFGNPVELEESALLPDGIHTAISIKVPLYDDADNIIGICGISTDITDRKKAEETLKKSHENLEKKVKERTSDLEEMNTALKVLLKKRDEDKKVMEAKINYNYKTLVSPFFQKLKESLTNSEQQRFMVVLESNLQKFLEPFSQKLSNPLVDLTPREIQIASMIKQGLSNKEIAQILNNSYRTITSHRNHIRKKLGLNNKKVNLRSYLSSL